MHRGCSWSEFPPQGIFKEFNICSQFSQDFTRVKDQFSFFKEICDHTFFVLILHLLREKFGAQEIDI